MEKGTRNCFVCRAPVLDDSYELNNKVNMPVCEKCKGSDAEKQMVEEMFDSLADGLVCGCI